jgi:hypothetical protein
LIRIEPVAALNERSDRPRWLKAMKNIKTRVIERGRNNMGRSFPGMRKEFAARLAGDGLRETFKWDRLKDLCLFIHSC